MKLWIKIPLAFLGLASLVAGSYLSLSPSPKLDPADKASISVSTTPLPLTIYCPGPLAELGGEDGTELGAMALIGKAKLWTNTSANELAQEIPTETEVGVPLALISKEQTTAAISANQTQVAKRQRMLGVAAANCSQPLAQGVFPTGMASVGRESILLLANPFANEVQVYLEFALSTGVKRHLVTLAGFEQQQISLAPFVDAEPNFALSFSTNGPKVSVTLQLRTSSGLTATGVDLVSPTWLATELWIPGLQVFEDGYQAPEMNLYNPNSEEVKVLVTLLGVGNDSDVFEVTVPAGQLLNQLLELPVGQYIANISAAQPIAAAIRSQRIADTLDFAWLMPAEEFVNALTLPIPQLESELVVANREGQPITVSLMNGGNYTSLTIPAESQIRVAVLYPLVQLQSQSKFMATLQILSETGYAVINPTENENLGSDLQVAIR
jgi:hypothetical protein